jgi:hypothetical protein
MNNNKILNSLLLVMSASFAYSSSIWAACTVQQAIADKDATKTFSSSTGTGLFSATICGQQVSWDQFTDDTVTFEEFYQTLVTPGDSAIPSGIGITINGTTYLSGGVATQADKLAIIQAFGFIITQPVLSATSMASTSASSKVSDTVFNNIISPSIQTRSQQNQQQNRPLQKLIVSFADLKYERANFTNTNDRGNIGGFTASGSYDINKSFSVGAIIPYDHLAFNSFDADRTGTILYVKNTLKLPSNFELSTAVNGNYMYTATQFSGISGTNQLHTYGGGFSTRLKFDHNDSNFIPSAAFSYQYNKDNTNIQDNEQHLIKLGPSLGYRVLNNATIQASGSWTKDISQYKQLQNGNDFYDVGVEGAWSISDAWQLRGGYKKILGLTNYTSDSIYLGSAIKF